MAARHTITFDLGEITGDATLIGEHARVITNLEKGVFLTDTTGKRLVTGEGPVVINPDGTGEMSLLESTSPDYNLTGAIKYTLLVPVTDRDQGHRVDRSIGPFTVTTSDDLSDHVHEFETPATSVTWRDGFRDEMGVIRGGAEEALRLAASLAGAQSGVLNPGALAPWRAALTATTGAAKVVIVGDSISDGALASAYSKTYPMLLQGRLRTLTNTVGGVGYVPATPSTEGAIVPNVPNTRAGTPVMWGHGLGGRAMHIGAASDHVTYTAQPCTKVKVYYGKSTVGTGGIKVSIDGVDQGVVLSSIGSTVSGGHVWESPALTPGNHTVKLTPQTPPFVGIVEGVEFINGDETTGVRVFNGAHSGGTVAAYNQTEWMSMHWQSVAAVDPDLAVVMLGVNDLAATTPEAFLAGMDSLVAKVPAGVPVLLVGAYLRGDYATEAGRAKWQQMQAGLRARATGRVAYLDLAPHWPELVADGSTSLGLMADVPPIHPNDAGMDKIADVLAAALGHSADLSFKGQKGDTGPQGPSTPAGVSFGGLTLSAGSPVVPELKNVNEWVVTGSVQVQLPTVANGSQFTVLVKSGFQGLTWPNGTQVIGATEQSTNVAVTLARLATGWTVFVPTGGGGSGMVDTGWTTLFNAFNNAGTMIYITGTAAMLKTGWTVAASASVAVRRSGSFLLVKITGGFTRTTGGGSAFVDLPAPDGLLGEAGMACLNTATVSGAKATALYTASVLADGAGTPPPRHIRLGLDGTVAAGTVAVTQGPLLFTIDPASTWGD